MSPLKIVGRFQQAQACGKVACCGLVLVGFCQLRLRHQGSGNHAIKRACSSRPHQGHKQVTATLSAIISHSISSEAQNNLCFQQACTKVSATISASVSHSNILRLPGLCLTSSTLCTGGGNCLCRSFRPHHLAASLQCMT